MSNALIPFVILEACPDYKRPYVLPIYGMVEECKLTDTILEKLVDFVYSRIDIDELCDLEDIDKFWDEFYSDYYMENSPWEAKAIVNGAWENVNPTNEELFNALITIKNEECTSSDSENDSHEETEISELTPN